MASSVKKILGDLNEKTYVELLSELIGESKYVQNNPPDLIPEEDRIVKHVMEKLLPYSTTTGGGPLIINHVSFKPNRGNLIVEYPGTVPNKTVSFVGMHMDVVTANPSEWEFDPFSLSIHGDELRGRGTTDCLGHVALVAELMKTLGEKKPQLKSTVLAVFIASEENSSIPGVGVEELAEQGYLDKSKNGPLYWIDTSDKQPCIGTAGMIAWKLKTTGKLFHSGMPDKAINPLELSMEALNKIQLQFYDDFPAHSQEKVYKFKIPSTMKPTGWEYPGGGINQIPAECTISGDVRLTPFYDLSYVLTKLQKYVDDINEHIEDLPTRGPVSKYVLPDENLRGKIELSITEANSGVACKLDSVGYKVLSKATKEVIGSVDPFSLTGSLPLIKDLQDKGYDVQCVGYDMLNAVAIAQARKRGIEARQAALLERMRDPVTTRNLPPRSGAASQAGSSAMIEAAPSSVVATSAPNASTSAAARQKRVRGPNEGIGLVSADEDVDNVPLQRRRLRPRAASPSAPASPSSRPEAGAAEASPPALPPVGHIWAQRGFQAPEFGSTAWREIRREASDVPPLFNFQMTNLQTAAEIGPAMVSRISTAEQVADFKKLTPFQLKGLMGGLLSLQASAAEALAFNTSGIATLAREKLALAEENQRLKADALGLSARIEQANKDKEALRVEVNSLQEAVREKDQRIVGLDQQVADLQTELRSTGQSHKELVGSLIGELRYRRSDVYTQKIIADFKKSPDFGSSLSNEAAGFLERGAAHMVRQLCSEVDDPEKLARLFVSNFFDGGVIREGSRFVPYTREELRLIQSFDESLPEGERPSSSWVPPEVSRPHFFDYVHSVSTRMTVEEVVAQLPPDHYDEAPPVADLEPAGDSEETPPSVDLEALGL